MKRELWSEGLRLDFRIQPTGLGLAALYALACLAARSISLDQFHLPAGLRVAALLLVPPRLWPYLLIGEYAYLAHIRYPMIEELGLPWVILGSIFLLPLVALVVRLHASSMKSQQIYWLLSLAACSAVLIALLRLSTMHLLWPSSPQDSLVSSVGRHVLGEYIGILTIAPLALLWLKRREASAGYRSLRTPSIGSVLAVVALGSIAGLIPAELTTLKTSVQLTMVAPVVALTCMHGWRGAAVGVPLLNLAVHLTTPSTGLPGSFDASTFKTQQIIAVAGTGLLALGSRISHLYHEHLQQRSLDRTHTLSMTRSAQMAGEMDLRARALDIRSLGDNFDQALSDMADWLKHSGHEKLATRLLGTTVLHSRKFREQVSMVYPTSLEHVGLYLALQIGGISEKWNDTNRLTLRHLAGDPCRLSTGLQLATYRTLTEAVSLLIEGETGQIEVRARCGGLQRTRGILVSVTLLGTGQLLSADTVAKAAERLTGRAIVYGGTVQCRRNRIRILLVEDVTS